MSSGALGLIETFGYIGAVEAADVCLKAANVKLIGVQLVSGGLVTVEITGDVGAVKASIDASKPAVEKVGQLVSAHVIPRPAAETSYLYTCGTKGKEHEAGAGQICERAESRGACKNDGFEMLELIQKLNSMKVVELRAYARKLEGIRMERDHIKYATRKELLEAILEHHERKS
ncbi:MAG TPA: BMC domain-containing protein [Clostridia bacterium]|nr:BMC domain-containing protein [Clostridia bacterium]